jgi:hypothetical protein
MASPRADALRRALTDFYAAVAPHEGAAKVEYLVARVVGGPPSSVSGMVVGGVMWSEAELFEKLAVKYGASPSLPAGDEAGIATSDVAVDGAASAPAAVAIVPLRFEPCGDAQYGGNMVSATFDCSTCPWGARVVVNAHVGRGWVFCGTERHSEWGIWIGAYLRVSGAAFELMEGDDGEQWSGDECVGRFALVHDGSASEIVVTYGTRAD